MKKILFLLACALLAISSTSFGMDFDLNKIAGKNIKKLDKQPVLPKADPLKDKEYYYASKELDTLYICHYKDIALKDIISNENPLSFWGCATDLDSPKIKELIDQRDGDSNALQWYEYDNSQHNNCLNDFKKDGNSATLIIRVQNERPQLPRVRRENNHNTETVEFVDSCLKFITYLCCYSCDDCSFS